MDENTGSFYDRYLKKSLMDDVFREAWLEMEDEDKKLELELDSSEDML